jgi:hypothetical protein
MVRGAFRHRNRLTTWRAALCIPLFLLFAAEEE